jgi:hypothetical protein
MRYYILMHLSDYNRELSNFKSGDWVATSGDTGKGSGPHLHVGCVEKGFLATLVDFFRGSGLHVDPTENFGFDTTGQWVTLPWLAVDNEWYFPENPHLGVDWSFRFNKLISNKPITIHERGNHGDFGNYIIYSINESQPAPQPSGQLYVNLQPEAGLVTVFKDCDKASGRLSKEVGKLNPAQFGGLTYTALEINDAGTGHRNVVIDTDSFGGVWVQMDYDYRDLTPTQSYPLVK